MTCQLVWRGSGNEWFKVGKSSHTAEARNSFSEYAIGPHTAVPKDAQGVELARLRLGGEEVRRSINERICETTSMVSSDEVTPIR